MVLLTTPSGNRLLAIYPDVPPQPAPADAPLTFALVITRYQGRYVLVYNPQRAVWEMPGGGLLPGEHPDAAARRELLEETGQHAARLRCLGLFKMRFVPEAREEYGALYAADIDTLEPFVPNEEAEQMALYDTPAAAGATLSPLTRTLIDWFVLRR
ncbi:MAG: NUDIX hydrolase [Anaerolineae bacterium]|nr:NUDIX hydrolase [Anaerolineae bacterium]